jgi:hypothetical protein
MGPDHLCKKKTTNENKALLAMIGNFSQHPHQKEKYHQKNKLSILTITAATKSVWLFLSNNKIHKNMNF